MQPAVLSLFIFVLAGIIIGPMATAAQGEADINRIEVNWQKVVAVSQCTPTLQVVVNPQLERGAKLHDSSFAALRALGADYVRYVPWLPYPRQAVAELSAPSDGKTSWDFSHIDPTLEDFMRATQGHSVVINFSTIPAWMFKTEKPMTYPDNPDQVYWYYTQGTELRDPSMNEVAQYFARLLSWYERGGFTDEYGKWHASGHHYKFAYWEVLNEIDFEHSWSPQAYTRFYDTVAAAMRAVDPKIHFMAIAVAHPGEHPEMFDYFLNPGNHRPGTPLDYITYHFYAEPTPDQSIEDWQYTFFDQADGFLNTVRFINQIRKYYSPLTKTDLDEVGSILPEDWKEIGGPVYVGQPAPPHYWNLSAALYAYLYVQAPKLGIDVIGESQLVGYHSQFPSVSMMDPETARPNARYWVLKLLKDNFGPGDKLVETSTSNKAVLAQAFSTKHGPALLVINKRNRSERLRLPENESPATVSFVAPSTGEEQASRKSLEGNELVLEPFEVAVITLSGGKKQ